MVSALVVGQVGECGHTARQQRRGGGRPMKPAGAAAQARRHHRAVVGRLEVAVLVLFVDHRLGCERLAGRRRRGRLRVDHQLAGRRRADDDRDGRRRGQAAAGELERDGLGLVVGQMVNVATPPETVAVVVPWSGPVPLGSVAVTTVLLSPVSMLPYWSSS